MRRRVVAAVIASFTLLAGGLGLGYRWFTTSTPVSTEDAVRRFQQQQKGNRAAALSIEQTPLSTRGTSESMPPARAPTRHSAPPSAPAPVLRPDPGVYTWRTVGFEEALGIHRNFPPTSQRIVTVHNDRRFSYHHFYSEEHQEWFEGRPTTRRVLVPYVRTQVVFGPFGAEIEVNFDPAMVFTNLPFVLDSKWDGKWSGDTYGQYSARVFERTRLRVGDRTVEAWGIHLHFRMHGEVEGEQDLRAWIAPAHRTTVREEYVVTGRLRGKPGTYHGEWTISLSSLTPKR